MATQKEHMALSLGRERRSARVIDIPVRFAERHLELIEKYLYDVTRDAEGFQVFQPHVYQNVDLHLRAFFWELVSGFDLLLQRCNDHFQLGISEHTVTWTQVERRKGLSTPGWSAVYSKLAAAHSSSWFSEVTRYRNYSHRSFLTTQTLNRKNSSPIIAIFPAIEGQAATVLLLPLVKGHLSNAKSLMEEIKPLIGA